MTDRTDAVPSTDIAVIGMSCRFPGADDTESFWRNLALGVESVAIAQAPLPSASSVPSAHRVDACSVISGAEWFDAEFFGYTPKEAELMDPQQRLFLECAWEALENAGLPPDCSPGQVGVYAGAGMNTYLINNIHPNRGFPPGSTFLSSMDELQVLLGSERDFMPTRVSYKLNLKGPSVNVQTACSTALVTVHLACQGLLNGECDLALAGAATILTPQGAGYFHQPDMIWSSDGHCRAFDARADGTVFGNGVGVVVLKLLSEALADGDPIHAVIKGSAVNNDGGLKAGFTAPSVEGQVRLVGEALAVAGVDAASIGYVEGHGTGTALGDPMEVAALTQVFRKHTQARQYCALGSVKTNLGHLGWAAGMAGLIKTVLALKHRQIPATLHFAEPNPKIDFASSPFYVNAALADWESSGEPRRAGVSAFGMGGTNAHVILEEAPAAFPEITPASPSGGQAQLFTLSARSGQALRDLASRHEAFLGKHLNLELADVCNTANTGRSQFERRAAFVAESTDGLRQQLAAFAQTPPGDALSAEAHWPGKIAFLFTGQGSQYLGMGRYLYETQPVFRRALERCDEILHPLLGEPLLALLYPQAMDAELPYPDLPHPNKAPQQTESFLPGGGGSSRLDQTACAQPALFALEYALAELWQSWGIRPDAVLGHSVGEYVAACVAGVFSLEDGLQLIAARGQLMGALPADGAMAAALADSDTVAAAIQAHAGISIAAINAPGNRVVSGKREAVEAISADLARQGIEARPLRVSHAFHSALMEPMIEEFGRIARQMSFSPPKIKLISNLTGKPAGAEIATPDYWLRHIRQPVQFQAGVETLASDGVGAWVEIGPKPTLLGLARQCLEADPKLSDTALWLPSLRPGQNDRQAMLASLGELYVRGLPINWAGVEPMQRRRLNLPTYPFQRQRHWIEPPDGKPPRLPSSHANLKPLHPLLGQRIQLAGSQEIRFETLIDPRQIDWVRDHSVFGTAILPGTAYVEMALAAALALKTGRVRLEQLRLHHALRFPENRPQTVQIVLVPTGEGNHAFHIYSLAAANTDQTADVTWVIHADGTVAAATQPAPPVDLPALQAQCTDAVSAAAIYQCYQDQGMAYGPSYRILQTIWRQGETVLGEMAVPASLTGEASAYQLHPVLLDAGMQLLEALTGEGHGQTTLVPVGLDSLEVHAQPGTTLWAYARMHPADGSTQLTADIQLVAPDGQAVATIRNMRMRRVGRQAMLGEGGEPWRDWFFEVAWRTLPDLPPSAALPPTGTNGKVRSKDFHPVTQPTHLIFADAGGVGEALASLLCRQGGQALLVFPGSKYSRREAFVHTIAPHSMADCQQLLKNIPQPSQVIYLWGLDAAYPPKHLDGLMGDIGQTCGGLLNLVRGLLEVFAEPPDLCLVTREAQAVVPGDRVEGVAQSPLWGMGKVIALEHPELHCICYDAGGDTPPERLAAALWAEINAAAATPDQAENQLALRYGQRYAARLRQAQKLKVNLPSQPFRLEIGESGVLDSLQLRPHDRHPPAAHEVELRVHATALNFRDVLNAMGLYPGNVGQLGTECAGVVVGVGGGVKEFQIGDEVIATTVGCFSQYATMSAEQVYHKPKHLSFAEAASIFDAYSTADYCLRVLARMAPGDRVLIHAATGGVGLAAVRLAQRAGAEVFATASPGKWGALRSFGVAHIYHSRTLDFANQILADTNGLGVDIVLNSLTGEGFVEKNLAALTHGGRFVEISKRDAWDARRTATARPDIEYYLVDLGEIAEQQPAWLRAHLSALLKQFEQGLLHPLPMTEFPMQEAVSAFRYMQQAKHIGKIVVTQSEESPVAISSDGTYLITGGLGGLGLQMARWLVGQGARHLKLMSRRPPSPAAQALIGELEQVGTQVIVIQADVADPDQMEQALALIGQGRPLRGVIHAAGVLDDGGLLQLSLERFNHVLDAKIRGVWNLHALLKGHPLDFFVLFSSLSALLGNRGQANYAAANAFLDAFAHYRQSLGLPALSIGWGAWAEVGMATGLQAKLEAQGMGMIHTSQGLQVLAHVLRQDIAQIGVSPMEWQQFLRHSGPSPFLGDFVRQPAHPPVQVQHTVLRSQLEKASPRQRHECLVTCIQQEVTQVLGLRQSPSPQQGFFALGVDSLMSIEVRNRLQALVGIPLPPTLLFNHPSIQDLAEYLVSLFAAEERPPATSGTVGPVEKPSIDKTDDTATSSFSDLETLINDELVQLHTLLND